MINIRAIILGSACTFLVILGSSLCQAGWAVAEEHGSAQPSSTGIPEEDPAIPGSCFCTENYAPVVCNGGVVFSNACVAACAEAKGCHPASSRGGKTGDERVWKPTTN